VTDRLLLVATSPRLPGLLSAAGWDALRVGPVFTADEATEQAAAVRAAGIEVTRLSSYDERGLASAFREHARSAAAVWLAGPDGDPGFARALGDLLARAPEGAELEVVYGSWDPPGARLLDVVAVMDRLRSPGGCPWDAEQTSASLAPYLLEEAYEAYAALEDDDPVALREELGTCCCRWCSTPAWPRRTATPRGAWTTSRAAWSTSWYAVTRTSSPAAP